MLDQKMQISLFHPYLEYYNIQIQFTHERWEPISCPPMEWGNFVFFLWPMNALCKSLLAQYVYIQARYYLLINILFFCITALLYGILSHFAISTGQCIISKVELFSYQNIQTQVLIISNIPVYSQHKDELILKHNKVNIYTQVYILQNSHIISIIRDMSCIFASSKYYQQSYCDPTKIAPPIGYSFLSSGISYQRHIPQIGERQHKQVNDRPHKVLSQRKTPLQKLQEYLKITQAPKRSEYLASSLIQFMRNDYTQDLYLSISAQYVPNWKQEYGVVELVQLISNPRVQGLAHIQDYGLTKFFCLCEGTDMWKVRYLHEFFNRKIIEYQIQIDVINHRNYAAQQYKQAESPLLISPGSENFRVPTLFPAPVIADTSSITALIDSINQSNKKKDPLYTGVHLYFADFSELDKKGGQVDYFQRQLQHYDMLLYYIIMMTGLLANGQTAIIRLCGSFRHKTFQILFILKLIFKGKVSLCKPLGSNPFLPDSYVTCQYYNKPNGDIIHKYLLSNYNLPSEHNTQTLLLDPKRMLKQDTHTSLRYFNQNLINKGIQIHIKQFKKNSSIEYYPSKEKLLEKTIRYAMDIQPCIKDMVGDKDLQNKEHKDNQNQGKESNEIQQKAQGEKEAILDGNASQQKQTKFEQKQKQKQIQKSAQKNPSSLNTKTVPKNSFISTGFFPKKKNNPPNKN